MNKGAKIRNHSAGTAGLIVLWLGQLAFPCLGANGYAQPSLSVHQFVAFQPVAAIMDPYRSNTVWIATSGGLMKYNFVENSWKNFTTEHGLSRIWCSSLFVERDFVVVGTTAGGANLFDLRTERFIPFAQYPVRPSDPDYRISVSSILADSAFIWIGSEEGLLLMDRGSLDTLRHLRMADGLASDYVNDITDDGISLWLATGFRGSYAMHPPRIGGLTQVKKSSLEVTRYTLEGPAQTNYLNSVLDIGKSVYVGGAGGLFRFDKTTEQFFRIAPDVIASTSQVVTDGIDIWCAGFSTSGEGAVFCVDMASGTLKQSVRVSWPGHWRVSLATDISYLYVLSEGMFTRIRKSSLDTDQIALPFLPASFWTALNQDQHVLYAAGENHLSILDESNLSIRHTVKFEGGPMGVRHIALDAGSLWLSADRGLYVYDRSTLKLQKSYFTNPLHSIQSVVLDESSVWVNAHQQIFHIDRKHNIVERVNFGPFASMHVLGLVAESAALWVSFRASESGSWVTGVAKIDRASKSVRQLTTFPVAHYDHALTSLIDRGTYLLAGGKQISKISKEDLTIQPFLDYVTGKMVLKGLLLWTSHPEGTVRAFNVATGDLLFTLNQSSGILHNWITDLSISRRYAWVATWQGISAFKIPEEYTAVPFLPPPLFAVYQNHPNPFNPSTSISYDVPERGQVSLTIFNVLGQKVATPVQGEIDEGRHTVVWDASGLPSGVYLYRLSAGSYREIKRMLLLK